MVDSSQFFIDTIFDLWYYIQVGDVRIVLPVFSHDIDTAMLLFMNTQRS